MIEDESIKKMLEEKNLEGLLDVLRTGDLWHRSRALDALKELGDEKAVGPILTLCNDELCYKGIWVLGELGDKRSVEPLMKFLDHEDRVVVGNTIDALAKIGDKTAVGPLVDKLQTDDPWITHRAVEALTVFGGKSMGPILDYLGEHGKPDSVFFHTIEKIGLPAVLPLTKALEDVLPTKRANAAYALRILGSEHAMGKKMKNALQKSIKPMVSLLEDPDEIVRGNAALALAGLHGTGVSEKLKALLKDPVEFPRAMAASALGILQERSAVEDVLPLLNDADASVRSHAAKALGMIKDEIAREGLLEKLSDSSEEVRVSALKALKHIGGESLAPDVARLLDDTSERVRLETLDALKAIDPGFAFDHITRAMGDKDPEIRLNATRLLGTSRDRRSVGPLQLGLKDPEAMVRRSAADALGMIGDPSSVDGLIASIVPGSDSNYNIFEAVKAVGQRSDVARAMKRMLEVGDFRLFTTTTVKQMDSLLFDTLANALERGARDVQENALQTVSLLDNEVTDHRLIDNVVKKINDADERMVKLAADAILSIGVPAAEPLSRALLAANERTKAIIREVFTEIRVPEVVEKVENLIKGTTVSVARETLGLLRSFKSVVDSTLSTESPTKGEEDDEQDDE